MLPLYLLCPPDLLKPEVGNQGLQAKSRSLPVFVNNVLQNTVMLPQLGIVCGCFCTTMTELSSCDIDHLACKTKIFATAWHFNRKSEPIFVLNSVPDHHSYIKISFKCV